MKYCVVWILGCAVGVWGAVFFSAGGGEPASADCPGTAGAVCGNGDVNGDGLLNIADPIYLLSHLFPPNGPAPVAFSGGGGPSALPATGQTGSYFDGDDGMYETGCPTEGRFVDNEDGTVTDNCTGLMWQQATAPGLYPWSEAIDYCETLDLAERTDWRLPNVRELQSIVDYGRFAPAIDPVFQAESFWYWSSSSDAGDPGAGAWLVYFPDGGVGLSYKGSSRHVRAVRSGP